jgi:hypothetical protein
VNPQVSVIVPTFNRERFLPDTLDSILAQTAPAAEVIVVDDGSTDGTRDLVSSRYAGRVRYIPIPNSGVCRARNLGVAASHSPWIAFCDSDDLWRPGRLESQLRLAEMAPEVDYVFTDFCNVRDSVWSARTKFSEDAAWQARLESRRIAEKFSVIREPLYLDAMTFIPIFPSTVLMSRKRFDAMGGFDEHWTRTSIEDFDFTLRCLQTPPFGVVDEPLVGIRRHDSNASGNRVRDLTAYVDILRHSKEHHTLGPPNACIIDHHIRDASIEAADLAFAAGQFDVAGSLLRPIPSSRLGAKMRLKKFVSSLPPVLRDPLSALLLKAAGTLRGGR